MATKDALIAEHFYIFVFTSRKVLQDLALFAVEKLRLSVELEKKQVFHAPRSSH